MVKLFDFMRKIVIAISQKKTEGTGMTNRKESLSIHLHVKAKASV